MSIERNLSLIGPDVEKVRRALGDRLARVGVFGSLLTKELTDAGDLDLVLFVRGARLRDVRQHLTRLSLSYSVRASAINGKYHRAPARQRGARPGYHLVVLDADRPSREFMRRNSRKIRFV